jgi:predicted ATP-grasp superfamily ATP-dependent carboligase
MERNSAPRALIVSLRNWFGAARLPQALHRAGFAVASLHFPGGLNAQSSFARRQFVLPQLASDDELINAAIAVMLEYRPELIIPGDDPTVEFLHALAAEISSVADSELALALRNSLGNPAFYASVQHRQRTHALAVEAGIRVPPSAVVLTLDDAREFAATHDFPIVLKLEGSCAGWGVAICRDLEAVEQTLVKWQSWVSDARVPGNLTVQKFIQGKTAMRATTAWHGEVLAGLSAIKRETNPFPTGPSSVVEFIDHPEMESAVKAFAAKVGLSGFSSADFIIEDGTNAAYWVELNPRPTPICHLGGSFGPDLCAALFTALRGKAPEVEAVPLQAQRVVALFPQEWQRDKHSTHLRTAFHDVPWEDPVLVQALVNYNSDQTRRDDVRREEGRRERLRARAYG